MTKGKFIQCLVTLLHTPYNTYCVPVPKAVNAVLRETAKRHIFAIILDYEGEFLAHLYYQHETLYIERFNLTPCCLLDFEKITDEELTLEKMDSVLEEIEEYFM